MKRLSIILVTALLSAWYFQFVFTQNEMQKFFNEDCTVCDRQSVDEFFSSPPPDTRFYELSFPADPDFAADLVWMRTAYYYGIIDEAEPEDFFYLPRLLSTITDLAPEWEFPYFFGAYALLLEAGFEEHGLALVRKGMAAVPDLWELWLIKGYYFMTHKKDYSGAAQIFAEASQKEGAPRYLAALSVTLALKNNERALAEQLFKIISATIGDEDITKRMAEKLK
jgi:hypothetical protein